MDVISVEVNGDQFKLTILFAGQQFVGWATMTDKEYRGYNFDDELLPVLKQNSILIRKLVKLLSLLYDGTDINFPVTLENL